MLISCPNCTTSYDIGASSLGTTGRSVRCVRCRHVWFATDPGVLAAVAQGFCEDIGTWTPSPAPAASPLVPLGPLSASAEPPLPPETAASELPEAKPLTP